MACILRALLCVSVTLWFVFLYNSIMLTLRGFIDDDPQLVLRLKEQAGWNQTAADLERFRKLSPEGCFVAQWDGQPVGCVMVFEFGSVAWIAMMLVDESFRGR